MEKDSSHGVMGHEVFHDVDGRRVRSLAVGESRAGRPDVVFVPGLGSPGLLRDVVAGCGSWTRAWLLDLPGLGASGPLSCPPSVEGVAEAASDWLRVAAPGPVLLFGHSSGAQSAVRVAADHPELVCGLVLAGLTFEPDARSAPGLLMRWLQNSLHEPPGQMRANAADYFRGGAAVPQLAMSSLRDRPEEAAAKVTCPTVLVRGRHDAYAGAAWVEEVAAGMPSARVVTFPGAHGFPYENGGATAALVRSLADEASGKEPTSPS